MPTTETIDVSQLPSYLSGIGRGMVNADFRPAWKSIGVLLSSEMKRNFDEQHGPDGVAWRPLTMNRARNPKGTGRILRDRGLLMASATGRGPNHISDARLLSFEWGTNLHYAAIHQYGGTIRPKKGRALAVPLTREAYRAGSPLNFPRPLHVVWPKGKRRGWLVETKGRGRRMKDVFHYMLMGKSVVPARPFLGVNDKLLDKVDGIIADRVVKKFVDGK